MRNDILRIKPNQSTFSTSSRIAYCLEFQIVRAPNESAVLEKWSFLSYVRHAERGIKWGNSKRFRPLGVGDIH